MLKGLMNTVRIALMGPRPLEKMIAELTEAPMPERVKTTLKEHLESLQRQDPKMTEETAITMMMPMVRQEILKEIRAMPPRRPGVIRLVMMPTSPVPTSPTEVHPGKISLAREKLDAKTNEWSRTELPTDQPMPISLTTEEELAERTAMEKQDLAKPAKAKGISKAKVLKAMKDRRPKDPRAEVTVALNELKENRAARKKAAEPKVVQKKAPVKKVVTKSPASPARKQAEKKLMAEKALATST